MSHEGVQVNGGDRDRRGGLTPGFASCFLRFRV